MLKRGGSAELKAKDKTLHSTLTVADNLKKELVEKAIEALRVAEENGQLKVKLVAAKEANKRAEERAKELEEENKVIAEERDHKVIELTHLRDEDKSQ